MPTRLTKQWICLISFLCLFDSTFARHKASENALKNSIEQQKQQHHTIQNAFKHTDEQINQLNHQLKHTHKQLKQQHASLSQLTLQQQSLSTQLAKQQTLLSQSISQAYKTHKNPSIQMILNNQDPVKASRILHYYAYLNKKRHQTISALKLTLTRLESTADQMKNYQDALQRSLKAQRKQQSALNKTRHHRTSMLKTIEQSIHSKQAALQTLQKNKEELDDMVKHLNRPLQKASEPFSQHSLPWPTGGKILQHYGESIQGSELKTHGIVIKGKEGTPVYSIADGKVIFAKWMSGFGLLMIVEHENGFLSLYGRNDSLDAEVNDKVHAGDQIASVGHSGAFPESGLYFAIRQGDKPIDPEKVLIQSG